MGQFFEHLQLPKAHLELPKKNRSGKFGQQRDRHRPAHGQLLLSQINSITQPQEKEYQPFGVDPKLIFKIKVAKNDSLESQLPSLGLTLLAKEPKNQQAIVVFADDDQLTEFQKKLQFTQQVRTFLRLS